MSYAQSSFPGVFTNVTRTPVPMAEHGPLDANNTPMDHHNSMVFWTKSELTHVRVVRLWHKRSYFPNNSDV